MITFIDKGVCIINPWMDNTGRFELSDDEAVKAYGLLNIINFVSEVLNELESREH